jgi:5-methyltetrahydrofolate--homocysteine methyltransferase
MTDWKKRLAGKRPFDWAQGLERVERLLVADGAWGTEFVRMGLAAGEVCERWNIEHADKVRAVAVSYVEAGADIILTNTFGGNPLKLAKAGLRGQAGELNRRGVEISREAARGKVLVFASMGPTGEFVAPLGAVSESEMVECFAEQVEAIVSASPDGIVIETMTDLVEAKAALRAVRENSRLPVVVTMTFQKGARGYATMMGVRAEDAARELDAAGADALGANCGAGIADIIEVAKLMRPVTGRPLWFKPNAGLPELVHGQTIYRETPGQMVSRLRDLAAAGADIVGGCCGATPEHIRLLAQEARTLKRGPDQYKP